MAQVVKVLTLHAQDPIWAPVLIPAVPLPIQLPACGLGKQSRTVQILGTLHLPGIPAGGSLVLSFFFFKDLFLLFFHWKGRYTERRDREEDLPSDDSFLK